MPDKKDTFDPRKDLDSARWHQMKLSQLYSQELLLREKIDVAEAINSPHISLQLDRGMLILQEYITEKTKDDPDPTTTIIMR